MSVRFARRRSRLLAAAATVAVLGAAMPLVSGASSAWACGDGPATVAPAVPAPTASAAVHQGQVQTAYLPGMPGTITAGGSPIEFGVEIGNFTGAAYDSLQPTLGFYNEAAGSHPGGGTNLRPEDFTVQVMTGGQWKTLPVHHGCDPVIYPDTSGLAQQLDNGHATRLMFRVALSAKAPADQHDITVYLGTTPNGRISSHALHIARLAAPSSPSASAPAKAAGGTPTKPAGQAPAPAKQRTAATPSAAPAQVAAVRAAAATSPTAVPSTATASTKQLAFTGGGSDSGLLLGAGGALVVLGAGAVTLSARRRSAARH
ncbi:hypothetical protein [Kitasatospora sp. NBC_01266]|uniref:hypothetical protein n=1 Tax=Kitasatospora sp. NBC_01266 TaxID=2903572 RepID=UPI002E3785F0|nr:hypothetical protein [Kitasatospora sp. NBC_01266]